MKELVLPTPVKAQLASFLLPYVSALGDKLSAYHDLCLRCCTAGPLECHGALAGLPCASVPCLLLGVTTTTSTR